MQKGYEGVGPASEVPPGNAKGLFNAALTQAHN